MNVSNETDCHQSKPAVAMTVLKFSLAIFLFSMITNTTIAKDRPNVVLVITDDQGYGDVAIHGNKKIHTPTIDKLSTQSIRLTNFHVDPTCAPTRSALMTGRYSTRTGVWHTIMGRSLMNGSELTVAEVFKSAGYRTAMYGKWHLGDNFPCRPQDQGFDETFYHGGGGVGQTPDYFGNDYFDDTYFRAKLGKSPVAEKVTGYCTDVWFNNAISFIEKNSKAKQPFFVYLSTNAPHGPFNVAEKYSKPYEKQGVPSPMSKFYGMIENIDENMARLLAKLDELKIADNTILIFMTDNGSAMGMTRGKNKQAKTKFRGFNAAMRGRKGSEYDGGHRVPFYIRWPNGGLGGKSGSGRDVKNLTAHIDVLPTLAELCGIKKPNGPKIDGTSLASLLKSPQATLKDRTLLVHSQRIEHVKKWRKSAVMTNRWRLINGKELYDMQADPSQTTNVANQHAEVVKRLTSSYEDWWKSLSPMFDQYVQIHLGNRAENPVHLTCHDWHTNNRGVPWNHNHIRSQLTANGFWSVNVTRAGHYDITLRRLPKYMKSTIDAKHARIKIGKYIYDKRVIPNDSATTFQVKLPVGSTRLQSWLTLANGKQRGAYFVDVKFVDDSDEPK